MIAGELEAVYGRHTFPHKRITWRITAARKPYDCEATMLTPAGHSSSIEPGEQYATVSILPTKKKNDPHRHGWHRVRICAACAVSFGLAKSVSS